MSDLQKVNTPGGTAAIKEAIRALIDEELYPAELFAVRYFPGLHGVLLNFFQESLKREGELWTLYCAGEGVEKLVAAARRILYFENILQADPVVMIMVYRDYIRHFVAFKHRYREEQQDIFQEILARLIEDKIYKIREKYDYNLKKISSFTSYLMVSVRNIYIDIIRERNIRPLTSGDVEEIDDIPDVDGGKKMLEKLLLQEELVKLKAILLMFYKTRAKLELCLKLKFRIPIRHADVKGCFPNCSAQDIAVLSQDFKQDKDKQVFEYIAEVFNRLEGRANKSDTLRKWIDTKVDEIVVLLNRSHSGTVYNSKNIADFFLFYYGGSLHDSHSQKETG